MKCLNYTSFFPISDDKLIPAEVAVESLCQISESEVSDTLGFPLITKAEPYTSRAEALVQSSSAQTHWLIAAVSVSTFLALVILAALLFLAKRFREETRMHQRLLASPASSSCHGENGRAAGKTQRSPSTSVSRVQIKAEFPPLHPLNLNRNIVRQ